MSTKHTPGPWDFNGLATVTACDDLYCVASVFDTDWDKSGKAVCREKQEANARLIAAAPCLLEALRESVAAMERMDAMLLKLTNSPFECEKGEITRAKLAISKAEGKEALTR